MDTERLLNWLQTEIVSRSEILFNLLSSNLTSRSHNSLRWITSHFLPILSFPHCTYSSLSARYSPWRWQLHCTSKLGIIYTVKTEVTPYTGDVNERKRRISNLYRISQYILTMGKKKILLCDEHRLRCVKFELIKAVDIKTKLFLGMMPCRYVDAVEEYDLDRILVLDNAPHNHPVPRCWPKNSTLYKRLSPSWRYTSIPNLSCLAPMVH